MPDGVGDNSLIQETINLGSSTSKGTEGQDTIVGSPTSAITTNNLPLRIGSKSDTAGQ